MNANSTSTQDTSVVHANARQDVIKVDEDDNELGTVNRLEAHTGNGIRHRAFTVLVFDHDGHILLAQRSSKKRLWDTYWDGTVASHQAPGQSSESATRNRLRDELGIESEQYSDLELSDVFEYKRYYGREGVEHEICAVLKCTLDDRSLDPNEDEVAGLMWVPYHRLYQHPRWYRQLRLCPWFKIAMRRDFADPESL